MTLVVGPAASASERELEEAPAPSSAREIETPIERVFPEEEGRRPLLPFVRERLEELPPFFADSELDANFRTYYLRREPNPDFDVDSKSEAWAMGGSIAYRSGRLLDVFSVEFEGFTSQPIVAPEDHGGTRLLQPMQDGYTVLGIANGRLEYQGYQLVGGRHYFDLPFLNRNDNRMTPNTFESIVLSKPEGDLRFSSGYTWRIKRRNSDEFETMTESLDLAQDRGLAHAGIYWDPAGDFDIGGVGAVFPDVAAGFYAESGYVRNATPEIELRLDGQFAYERPTGDELLDAKPDNAWNFGLRGSASYEGVVGRLGFGLSGEDGGVIALFGSNPSYFDLMQRTFVRADEKVFLVSASYDFGRLGLDGLEMILNFAAGFDGETQEGDVRDAQEVDVTLDYRIRRGPLESFWLRLRGSFLRDEGAEDSSDVRVILRYDFPVI